MIDNKTDLYAVLRAQVEMLKGLRECIQAQSAHADSVLKLVQYRMDKENPSKQLKVSK